jgi:hypothetical protein
MVSGQSDRRLGGTGNSSSTNSGCKNSGSGLWGVDVVVNVWSPDGGAGAVGAAGAPLGAPDKPGAGCGLGGAGIDRGPLAKSGLGAKEYSLANASSSIATPARF